jgi:hypothetical protein
VDNNGDDKDKDKGKKPSGTNGKKPGNGEPIVVVPPEKKKKPLPNITVEPVHKLHYMYDTANFLKLFGLVARSANEMGKNVPLTAKPDGQNQSFLVRVDNQKPVSFGPINLGQWVTKEEWHPIDPPPGLPLNFTRTSNSWQMFGKNIRITQVVDIISAKQPVEIKPGEWRWPLNVCLAGYLVENLDTEYHSVGLRLVLDTQIGSKDDVRFAGPDLPAPVTYYGFRRPRCRTSCKPWNMPTCTSRESWHG